MEPMSPALAGGFLTAGPPWKSPGLSFKEAFVISQVSWETDSQRFVCKMNTGGMLLGVAPKKSKELKIW